MSMFRALHADEVECRVGTCTEKGVSLLLYKTARVDYALLDETFGPFGWACSYEVVNGNLFCSISCRDVTTGGWVTKSNCGTESNQEAEKGEASDAFKRAAVAWGIGRELYTAPFVWVPADKLSKLRKGQNGKWQCLDRFSVRRLDVGDGRIVGLDIECGGKTVFSMGQAPARGALQNGTAGTPRGSESAPQERHAELVIKRGAAELAIRRGVSEAKVYGALDADSRVRAAPPDSKNAVKAEVLGAWLDKARG